MPITKKYKVWINIPEDIVVVFAYTKEYERKILEATKGNLIAGSNQYSNWEEWAEFSELKDAQECERRLLDVVYYFAAKLGDK